MSRSAALLLSSLAVACISGKGSDDDSSTSTIDINSAEDVATLCAESEPQTATLTVDFPATAPGCPWGEGDNLETEDAHVTARVEQVLSLDLPPGVVVCDLAFDFQGISGGTGTPMVYDDHFWFTFDDVVLAASNGPLISAFSEESGLPIYDWSAVAGSPFDFETATWCLGEDEGRASCDIPPPETNGIMSLSFEESLVSELSFRAVQQDRFDFAFITMGDNDRDRDCSHEDFSFTVEVPYVAVR
jgi:hypothetical protein